MRCPFCPFDGPRSRVHRHLADEHRGCVRTERRDEEGIMVYAVTCPDCGGEIRHQIKPRWNDPGFLEEFAPEIRLVAFDLLLYHREDAHPAEAEG